MCKFHNFVQVQRNYTYTCVFFQCLCGPNVHMGLIGNVELSCMQCSLVLYESLYQVDQSRLNSHWDIASVGQEQETKADQNDRKQLKQTEKNQRNTDELIQNFRCQESRSHCCMYNISGKL